MGEYQAVGWMQWPDHPDMSFQFVRALGAAQDGGATVSECFLTATRITPGDHESWYREWLALAERTRTRGVDEIAQGHGRTGASLLLRASNYYRLAEFFLLGDDARRLDTLSRIEDCVKAYIQRLSPPGESVRVPFEGSFMDAYFFPAPGADKKPVVIGFGGFDGYKDEMVHKTVRHMTTRGLSLLLVDLPGQGGTLLRQKMSARHDSEVPVGACIDYLEGRADVDAARIGVYGVSLGGYFAPRAASLEPRIKACVADGAMWDVGKLYASRNHKPDSFAAKRGCWVYGQKDLAGMLEHTARYRLEGVVDKLRCPFLVLHGEYDFVPLEIANTLYAYAKDKGVDITLKINAAETTGASHCAVDNPTPSQEFIADWLADRLKAS